MAGKAKNIEKPTSADIDRWKSQHGKILKYTATDGKVGYFKEPDIATMDASSAIAKSSPFRSNQIILNACFLGGDECIITGTEYIVGIMPLVQNLITKVEGEFSEL